MKLKEVRLILQTFWALEDDEKSAYYEAHILPEFLSAMRTYDGRFIRQMIRVMEERNKPTVPEPEARPIDPLMIPGPESGTASSTVPHTGYRYE